MRLPKFKVGTYNRSLPYYTKAQRLKNGKWVIFDQPLFSGPKIQLPEHFCNDDFWSYCNANYKTDIGSEFQKKIAVVAIGRKIKKCPLLKLQITNKWPFIKKRFTQEELNALYKAANSNFDLTKPIGPKNIPPDVSIPNHQVNHESKNGLMRLVHNSEHDGLRKNPHAGGMKLNNPEGFTEKNFQSKADYELYINQTPLPILCRLFYSVQNIIMAAIAFTYKFCLLLFVLVIIIILIIIILAYFATNMSSVNTVKNADEEIVEIIEEPINHTVQNEYYLRVPEIATFGFGTEHIDGYNETALNKIVKLAEADTTLTIVIYGCTCDIGDEFYNQKLSERRAANMEHIIIERYPFMSGRIKTVGLGEVLPDSIKSADRSLNRRVDIVIER